VLASHFRCDVEMPGLPGEDVTLADQVGRAFGANQVLRTQGLSSSGVSSGPCVSSV
jgi:hypothetical protein